MNKVNFNELGNEAPAKNFTGNVHVNMVLAGEKGDLHTVMGAVTFEKGARTNWHTHTTGQILLVTEGVGYYQEKGKPIEIIKTGEVIKIPKEVSHWHGASHESSMKHLAFVPNNENGDKGVTDWLEAVTDEQYNSPIAQ